MSQRRLPPPCRYVYVIGPVEGLQKIGIATDPRARLAALQTASPFKLVIHISVAVPFGAAHDVERRAHNLLQWKRASGEWFSVLPEEAVAAVRTAAGAIGPQVPGHGTLPLFAFTTRGEASTASRLQPPPATGLRVGLGRLWDAARRTLAAG